MDSLVYEGQALAAAGEITIGQKRARWQVAETHTDKVQYLENANGRAHTNNMSWNDR